MLVSRSGRRELLSVTLSQENHVPDNCAALKAVREKAFDLILTSEKTTGWEDVDLLCNIRRTVRTRT